MNQSQTELIGTSGLFDREFYEAQARRAFPDDEAAIVHYDAEGWRRGLNPSALFDTRFYLRTYPDIRSVSLNPLLHFVEAGRREGRRPRLSVAGLSARPRAPLPERWEEIAAARQADRRAAPLGDSAETVDVVIPVYAGYDDTLACIESVLLSSNRTPLRLVVIEDRSPEPDLVEALQRLAELGLIQLFRNERNRGFVATANKGLRLSRQCDVLLLNADTIVYGDWLDRIRSHARSTARVATVTPFSNNATILSYPFTLESNNQGLEVTFSELDALFADANAGQAHDIPTGVGFCMYVTRDAIREIGVLDEARFGRGYGEENDFCMRARAAGWRNLAALDVFVRHTGEVSFAADAQSGKDGAIEHLLELYPDYLQIVRRFIKADPLLPARRNVDLLRARKQSAGRGVLMLEHGWGGGVERHMNDLARLLRLEGVQSFRGAPVRGGRGLQLEAIDAPNLPNLRLDAGDPAALAQAFGELAIGHVHVHSLLGYELAWFEALARGIQAAGLSYDFTLHDYAVICPRITMVDWGGVYCASPSQQHCRRCIAEAGTEFGPVDIADWQEAYGRFLSGARRIFVPDPDVAQRLQRYIPELGSVEVRPHPEASPETARRVDPPADTQERIVGVLGAIGANKGASVLVRLAADALERGLPLFYRLYGHSVRRDFAQYPNVEETGPYADEEIEAMLGEQPPNLLFYPSAWPETFSYTLDIAFRTRLFPVSFDLGAPARRIREADFGATLPLELALEPGKLNDALLALEIPAMRPRPNLIGRPERRWVSADRYYGDLPSRVSAAQEG